MFPFLKKLFADAGYQGPIFLEGVKRYLPNLSGIHPVSTAVMIRRLCW